MSLTFVATANAQDSDLELEDPDDLELLSEDFEASDLDESLPELEDEVSGGVSNDDSQATNLNKALRKILTISLWPIKQESKKLIMRTCSQSLKMNFKIIKISLTI